MEWWCIHCWVNCCCYNFFYHIFWDFWAYETFRIPPRDVMVMQFFEQDKDGTIPCQEVGTAMRALGLFPSVSWERFIYSDDCWVSHYWIWPPGKGTAQPSWWTGWSQLWPLLEASLQVCFLLMQMFKDGLIASSQHLSIKPMIGKEQETLWISLPNLQSRSSRYSLINLSVKHFL